MTEFNQQLLNTLKGIENELIVSSFETQPQKTIQRKIFKLEQDWHEAFDAYDKLEKQMNEWSSKNIPDDAELTHDEFEELYDKDYPNNFSRYKKIDAFIDKIQNELQDYKDLGYIVRVQL